MMDKESSNDLLAALSAHDVRHLSPAEQGRFGLPVGNGDLAALVWTPADHLQITVNKSNAWDDAPDLPVADWHWSAQMEEKMTALVSCAALSFRNHLPLFETTYLDDFEARLHLRAGYVSVRAESPMCATLAKTYVVRDPDVLVVDYDETTPEEVEREITLSRWGSRRFFHWFAQLNPDTSAGLAGTTAGCDDEHVWIEQQLRRISFAVVARFEGATVRTDRPNSHTARITTSRAQQIAGQLFLAVVTSEDHEDPLSEARRRVDRAATVGMKALVDENFRRWQAYWSRSSVRIPDPYLENLYAFSLYQAGASATGAYPPMHHGGLWLWNHDAGNWGAYYHWNEQQMVWPVHASGHPDLAKGYYQWRFNSLGYAREMARKTHGVGGAFYTDVSDRDGRQAVDNHLSHNLTCGTQIAMDFWRHFLYTGDEEFLRARAYPMMKACSQFYLEYLEQDDEGVYHVPRSTCYEDVVLQRDSVTDLAAIRQSFAACIEAAELLGVDKELGTQWQDVLAHLADFTLVQENGQTVFASGIAIADGELARPRRSYKKGDALFNCWFWGPMAPVFPSGVVGLAQEGAELFEAARNTVRIVGQTSAGGWLPSCVFAARLGMSEEALDWLGWYVNRCQLLAQGFMREGHDCDGATDIWASGESAIIRNGHRSDEKTRLLSRGYDVPVPQCNCDLMTTIQEMLFQSHDGVLRVFPATPGAWKDAAFRLYAVGGFVVTAERSDGQTRHVQVESTRGGRCQVANPWPGRQATVGHGVSQEPSLTTKASVIEFETTPGEMYSVRLKTEAGGPLPALDLKVSEPGPRQAYGRMLGIPRFF